MPEDSQGWYEHIAGSIEMLRDELRSMEAAGATPEEFGLKVRSHPDTLIITARNKMGSGERFVLRIGLARQFVETHTLRRDQSSLDANRALLQGLASRLSQAGFPISGAKRVSGGWLLRGAPVGPILDFVRSFRNHEGSLQTDGIAIGNYIEDRRNGELNLWDVFFPSLIQDSGPNSLVDDSLGIPINCQSRSAGNRSDSKTIRVTNKQRVSSKGVEKTGLTPEAIAYVEEQYRQKLQDAGTLPAGSKSINYPDKIYREVREFPLLIVHLLRIQSEPDGEEHAKAIIAWSISFPRTEIEEKRVEYVVTTTWLRENEGYDLDEDDMAGDDE